jgi:kynurenine--oxoglutarate transaminase/cysteine-S-conjugate beta-lyase/glutamine--phenylpyruvate transaminase
MTPSIFQKFTILFLKKESINLGQGFPNWPIPDFLEDSLSRVLDKNILSENFFFGCSNLLKSLSDEYSPVFNRPLHPKKNFVVSTGGAVVISQICALLSEKDEVVVIESYFSFYEPMLRFFRVKLKFSRLIQTNCNQFHLDHAQIRIAVNSNTKWVFLNSPHNPTGKVINQEDIEFLNNLATEYPNLNFLSDEVDENIVFSHSSLPRLANYKNLFERTLNVYSGGKTYSCIGWRIGWAVGPEHLIDQLKDVQHCTNHAPSSLIQEALALAIPQGHHEYKGFMNFYEYLTQLFLRNV